MINRTLIARLLASGTGFWIVYTITKMMADEITRGVFNFTHFFGYFTMQSGTLTALVMLTTASIPFKYLHSPALDYARGTVTLYMTITIIVYHTLESPWGTWKIDAWSPIHVFAPIILLLMWFILIPPTPQHIKKWWPLSWMVYPFVFAVASVIRGMSDGWYPYGFLNVTTNGWQYVITMVIALIVGVAVLGYSLLSPSFVSIKHQRITKSEVEVF